MMYGPGEVPARFRQFFFVNAGGPSRKIVSREVVARKWQLVTLDCGHQVILAKYQKGVKLGCGFCGGLEPISEQPA
jgi:ribosomal protein S27AE